MTLRTVATPAPHAELVRTGRRTRLAGPAASGPASPPRRLAGTEAKKPANGTTAQGSPLSRSKAVSRPPYAAAAKPTQPRLTTDDQIHPRPNPATGRPSH